ncbi:MAG: hypothetical protein ABIS47_09015 [Acidimicrobiales bacterium]
MPELPESVPRGLLAAGVVLVLLGALAIIFAGGSLAILAVGTLLVLAGGGIGLKLGLDLWKATE